MWVDAYSFTLIFSLFNKPYILAQIMKRGFLGHALQIFYLQTHSSV